MREALAEIARGAWTPEQLRALRAAFQVFATAFDGILLLRGKRVSVETYVASAGDLDVRIDCPFRPKALLLLDVSSLQDGSLRHLATPNVAWEWTATDRTGTVRITDPFSNVPDGSYTLDVFMEKN